MVKDRESATGINKLKYLFDHIKIGLKKLFNLKYIVLILVYLLIAIYLINYVYTLDATDAFEQVSLNLWKVAAIIVSIFGLLILLYIISRPKESGRIEGGLQAIGLVNHLGLPPYLIANKKDDKNNKVKIYKFNANGISKTRFEDAREDIEQILNITISRIYYAEGNSCIEIRCVKATGALPERIDWNNKNLDEQRSVYIVGMSPEGDLKLDLNVIPHVLIGGSTGSGKTYLARGLLIQAMNKGEQVIIADLKGGIDYQGVWRTKAKLVTTEEDTLSTLNNIVEEMKKRKELLEGTECHNITEYNQKTNSNIERIVFMCDEVAELLDNTGLDKEHKMIINQIESLLSTLARLGRAFSINLILCTQRPDADVLKGQIKNNIDYRICGRCDEVLSRVIGVPDAHKLVPKNIPGRFLLYDGTIFQSYIFKNDDILEK